MGPLSGPWDALKVAHGPLKEAMRRCRGGLGLLKGPMDPLSGPWDAVRVAHGAP